MTNSNGYTLQAQLMRALAHPVRLEILHLLTQQEACVCHLTTVLRRPQPYVSQQLATLREAGLVCGRREGTIVYYRLADERLANWLQTSQALLRDENGAPVRFATPVSGRLADCPCPRCQLVQVD